MEETRQRDLFRAANKGRRLVTHGRSRYVQPSHVPHDERVRLVMQALRPIRSQPLNQPAERTPDPVLRLKGTDGSLLAAGETCILSGAPGVGKSTMVLQWLAQRAATPEGEWVELAGAPQIGMAGTSGAMPFEIRGGAGVIMTWEDSMERLRERALRLGSVPTGLSVMEMRARHLWEHREGGGSGPSQWWAAAWDEAADAVEGDGIVVIDPALSAFGASDIDSSAVRGFVDAVTDAAATRGMALLIVHHPAKNQMGIAGSQQWTAAARSVIFLGSQGAEVVKANYSPSRIS